MGIEAVCRRRIDYQSSCRIGRAWGATGSLDEHLRRELIRSLRHVSSEMVNQEATGQVMLAVNLEEVQFCSF